MNTYQQSILFPHLQVELHNGRIERTTYKHTWHSHLAQQHQTVSIIGIGLPCQPASAINKSMPGNPFTTLEYTQGKKKVFLSLSCLPLNTTLAACWSKSESSKLESLGHTWSTSKSKTGISPLANLEFQTELITPATKLSQLASQSQINSAQLADASVASKESTPSMLASSSLGTGAMVGLHRLSLGKKHSAFALTPVAHPLLDSHTFKVIVDVSIKIGKTDMVYLALHTQSLKGLLYSVKWIQMYISSPIGFKDAYFYDSISFPFKHFIAGMHYFKYLNKYSLSLTAKTENGWWIQFTVLMGI
jgi:hypothetical protein